MNNKDFLLALERERLDTSYKNPPAAPFRHAPQHSPVLTKRERKLWFDAGRYEAGARDKVAESAALKVRKLAGQE
jgi:hypothetical protein